jgi:cysteine synthase A
LDAFICATGTGGTLAGVTRYLTEKSEGRVEGWLADPPGSVLYNLVENGKAAREGNGSITEGEWGVYTAFTISIINSHTRPSCGSAR